MSTHLEAKGDRTKFEIKETRNGGGSRANGDSVSIDITDAQATAAQKKQKKLKGKKGKYISGTVDCITHVCDIAEIAEKAIKSNADKGIKHLFDEAKKKGFK